MKLLRLLEGAQRRPWAVLRSHPLVGSVALLGAFAGMAGTSLASTSATYDITPVTTSLTSDLTANVPVILGVVGALIALSIAVRMVRKFVRA